MVVLKAMGVESDQEAVALVGPEPGLAAMMIPSLEQAANLQWASGGTGVFTQQQALEWLGGRHELPKYRLIAASLHMPSSKWSAYHGCMT